MVNLTQASRELFRRQPDERFESFGDLLAHCRLQREQSEEFWEPSQSVAARSRDCGVLELAVDAASFGLNDWSFSQYCRLCSVDKQTVNRVSHDTARQIFRDTQPSLRKPLQVYTTAGTIRSIHGTNYSRLYDAELLEVIREVAPEFTPPPAGCNGGTGLYAGEQDLFAFAIDPTGWVEIDGEEFAPGYFVWNSEVGRRSVGIQTFWYQRICANHIVWDATEVFELKRKHAGNVQDALVDIRLAIAALVQKRDDRRDSFAKAIKAAMATKMGDDADEVTSQLRARGIGKGAAEEAVKTIAPWQSFSVFTIVDALTRIAGRYENAGDRLVLDQKAAGLLSLAA